MMDLAATERAWVYHGEIGISFHIIDRAARIRPSTLGRGEREIHGLLESDDAAALP